MTNKETESDDVAEKETESEEKFYYALDHEIRRSIIRLIGENEQGSFTEFKKQLEVSTGTLYHHLDVLKDLITQNKQRKYILTALGIHAYEILVRNDGEIDSEKQEQKQNLMPRFKEFIEKLIPTRLFDFIDKRYYFGIIISVSIIFISSILIFSGEINSSFIVFLRYEGIRPLPMEIRLWLPLKYLIGVISSAFITEILCRFLFQKDENTKKYLMSYSIALFPMLLYLGLYNIFNLIDPLFVETPLNKIIMVVFQLWTLWLLSQILIRYKQMRLERSLIISFLIYYGAISIILISAI